MKTVILRWLMMSKVAATVAVLAGLAGVGGFMYTQMDRSRGNAVRSVRLNNPGNIAITSDRWQGGVYPGSDSVYVEFESPLMGARAMLKLLRNYYTRYNLRSISGIVSRWAPSHENPTDNYIMFVANKAGISAQATFPADKTSLTRIAHAMAHFEAGYEAFSLSLFEQAWDQYL